MVRTSTAEAHGYVCPVCGDELSRDPGSKGFVRHLSIPGCPFERRQRDEHPGEARPTTSMPAVQRSRSGSSIAHPVRKHLREWAADAGIATDADGYTLTLNDNLFAPLSPESRREFAAGDGGELGKPGQRGKMQALHSSSALAANVFEYWRHRDASPLAAALGLESGIAKIEFEHKFPTGLPGNAPNLDVVFTLASGSIVAIESKFLEPYGAHTHGFKAKYFESVHGLWASQGWRECQALAQRLQSHEADFRWLHAEQLLKHLLGLAHSAKAPWSLTYLWYAVPGRVAEEHAAEAAEFERIAREDGIEFTALTYQDLMLGLQVEAAEDHSAYLAYITRRYRPMNIR